MKIRRKNFFIKNKKKINNNNFIIGIINITVHGYAFVNSKILKKDIFIPKNKTNNSLEGDLVKVKLKKKKKFNYKNKKIQGEVFKILKRNNKKFIGILKFELKKLSLLKKEKYNYGNTGQSVFIKENNLKVIVKESKDYNHNDKVLVEIKSWPKKLKHPLGKIIKNFGKVGEYKSELNSLLEKYHIKNVFPKRIEKEIKNIILNKNIKDNDKRKDMRNVNTFTIDPLYSKDFDDAISIKKISRSNWEIGIHISDVTHYVKEGSELDKEAYIRSCSVYLHKEVIPMLPNILSNDLCSLQPKKDKLSFSFIFNMDKNGKLLKSWFGKTIIQSKKRFTYDEVQNILDEKKGDFYEEIKTLFLLSKILGKKRLKNGSLFLEKTEVNFHLDKKNNPISIFLEKNYDAHRIIEEFMLLTNQKISEFVSLTLNRKYSSRPYVYRIHDKPDFEKLFFLKKMVYPLGYFLDLKNIKNSINKLLIKSKGKPEQNIIENLVLRSMSKAKYSTKNKGHYGLSFLYYTHFTSPIRRYSDIIAHRLLNYYMILDNEKKDIIKVPSKEFYEKKLEYCSNKERLITELERDFMKYMQAKFMKKFIGNIFEGIITGFNKWNIYVGLIPYQTEGVIKLCDIKKEKYTLDLENYKIIRKKNKNVYSLGDKIKVKLLSVDLEIKKIIFFWID